jgi:hypothetical protein
MIQAQDESKTRYYIFILISIFVQAVWIINSDGFYYIDDSCHFNYNVHFLSTIEYSVGFWHRLGRVLLFFIPSQFGLKGVQIFSSLIFTLTYLLSYKILKIKKVKYAEWIIPVIAFQPVLFNISYTVLAELPAGFLFILSYYFFLKDRPYAAMISASAIFLFRTELYFITGIYFLIYLFRKKYFVLPFIIAGPLFWYLMSFFITDNALVFFDNLRLHNKLPRVTEGVQWYHYFIKSPKIFGVFQTVGFMAGLWLLFRNKLIKDYYIPLIFVFGGIIINTLLALEGFNISCSTGQLRYVATVGPAFGLISVLGFEYFFGRFGRKKYVYILLFILIILLMFITGPFSTPFHKKYEIEKFAERIAELQKKQYPDYVVISAIHQIANAMEEPATGNDKFRTMSRENIEKYPKAIIVWEKYLETSPFGGEPVFLKYIEELPNVRLLDSVNTLTVRDDDTPLYKIFNGYNALLDNTIQYFISEQNTWEHLVVKIYIKD